MSQISPLALIPATNTPSSAAKLSRVVAQGTVVPTGITLRISLEIFDEVFAELQNVVNVGGEVTAAELSTVAH